MPPILKHLLFMSTVASMFACSTLKPRITKSQQSQIDSSTQRITEMYRNLELTKKVIKLYQGIQGDSLEKVLPSIVSQQPKNTSDSSPYDQIMVLIGPDPKNNIALQTIDAAQKIKSIAALHSAIYDAPYVEPIIIGNFKDGFEKSALDSSAQNNITHPKSKLLYLSQHGNVVFINNGAGLRTADKAWHTSTIKNGQSSIKTIDLIETATQNDTGKVDVILDNCKGAEVCQDAVVRGIQRGKPILRNGSTILAFASPITNNHAKISAGFLTNNISNVNNHKRSNFFMGNLLHHLSNMRNNDFAIDQGKEFIAQLNLAVFDNNQCKIFNLDAFEHAKYLAQHPIADKDFEDIKQTCIGYLEKYGLDKNLGPNKFIKNIETMTLDDFQQAIDQLSTHKNKITPLLQPDKKNDHPTIALLLLHQGITSDAFDTVQNAKNQAYGINTPKRTKSPALKN